jgi:hypothetical protein
VALVLELLQEVGEGQLARAGDHAEPLGILAKDAHAVGVRRPRGLLSAGGDWGLRRLRARRAVLGLAVLVARPFVVRGHDRAFAVQGGLEVSAVGRAHGRDHLAARRHRAGQVRNDADLALEVAQTCELGLHPGQRLVEALDLGLLLSGLGPQGLQLDVVDANADVVHEADHDQARRDRSTENRAPDDVLPNV